MRKFPISRTLLIKWSFFFFKYSKPEVERTMYARPKRKSDGQQEIQLRLPDF